MRALDRSEPSAPAALDTEGEAVLLEWTVHLLRRDPRRLPVVAAAAILAAGGGLLLFQSPFPAAVGLLVVLSSVGEYLLPTRYRITSRRVAAACGLSRSEMDWSSVRRVMAGPLALRLSPLPHSSRLDAFRGVLLRYAECAPGGRDDVIAAVKRLAPEATFDA